MKKKRALNSTLSEEAIELCAELGARLGVSRSGVIEMAVREFAERRKPPAPADLPPTSATA